MDSKNRNILFTVSLIISSAELTPNDIAERLQLKPTTFRNKEFSSPGCKKGCEPQNYFNYEILQTVVRTSSLTGRDLVERNLAKLLDVIEPLAFRLESLREHASMQLSCAVASPSNSEWFVLSENIIARINTLRLPVAIFLLPSRATPGEKEDTSSDVQAPSESSSAPLQ